VSLHVLAIIMSAPNCHGTQLQQSSSKTSFLNLLFFSAVHMYVDVTADCSVTCGEGFEDGNMSEIK
jgi:hypothetical protein